MQLRPNSKGFIEAKHPKYDWIGTSTELSIEELVQAKKDKTLEYFTKTYFGENGVNRVYVSLELKTKNPFEGL